MATSPPPKGQELGAKAKSTLLMLFNLAIIAILVVLDCFDLIYKTTWIGPTDSFSFRGGYSGDLEPTPLVPIVRPPNASDWKPLTAPTAIPSSTPIGISDSGWVSFLSRCEQVHPFHSGGNFFLLAMGVNCHVDENTNTTWPKALFASSMHVDSITWTCCELLPVKKRPAVCYEEIAANFLERYHIYYPELLKSPMRELTQAQEQQLLRFLDMVADSLRMAHRMICVEIMEWKLDIYQDPFAFGCGSANVFRSEFVFNDDVWQLLHDKGWLTLDALQIAGFQFAIRQSEMSRFMITNTTSADGKSHDVHVQVKTSLNFSSFGHFYALLLVIDSVLLLLDLWSSIEIFRRFIAPELTRVRNSNLSKRLRSSVTSMLKSRSNLSSEDAGVPNAASPSPPLPTPIIKPPRHRVESRGEAAHDNDTAMYYSFFSRSLYRNPTVAVLTFITQCLSWFIILPNSVVWTWSESNNQKLRAYQTSIRVWVLLLLLVHELWDGIVALNESLAYQVVRRTFLTSMDVILAVVVSSLALRPYIFNICEIKWRYEHQRTNDIVTFPNWLAHGNSFSIGNFHVSNTPMTVVWTIYKPLVLILFTGCLVCVGIGLIKFIYYSMLMDKSKGAVGPSIEDVNAVSRVYRRLPMEVMLDTPIRARSLIRNDLALETLNHGHLEILPSVYADFGVMISDGFYRSRTSFGGCIKPLLHRNNLRDFLSKTECTTAEDAATVPTDPKQAKSM